MAKKRIGNPEVDSTLETTDVEVAGKIYHMCFNFRALRLAERELNAAGHRVNILAEFPRLTLDSICIMFAACIHAHHPEVDFAGAEDLLLDDIAGAYRVATAIEEGFIKMVSRSESAQADGTAVPNPIPPGQ